MTFELVDESDVRKVGDKDKKPGLRFVDESEIKKIVSEKKSWLDIIDASDVIKDSKDLKDSKGSKDPKIELVDKSYTIRVGEKLKKSELEFVAKERVVNCERQRAGMTNNCALCKELSNDRFNRCTNKYGGY